MSSLVSLQLSYEEEEAGGRGRRKRREEEAGAGGRKSMQIAYPCFQWALLPGFHRGTTVLLHKLPPWPGSKTQWIVD